MGLVADGGTPVADSGAVQLCGKCRAAWVAIKGKDNGLRDVIRFVVTELPYLEWCLWCGRRRLARSAANLAYLTGGRQRRRDNGESERPHGSGT